jgi:signal transduction histidine kinase
MMFLPRKWNSTIRTRLTVLYAGAFFLAGLVLIGLMYFQLNQVIGQQLILRGVIVGGQGASVAPSPTTTVRIQRAPGDTEAPQVVQGSAESEGTPSAPVLNALAEAQAQLRTARTETLKRVVVVSIVSLVAVSGIAAFLGWVLAGQALEPLRQITATARGIADRNLHQRIAIQGPQDEIKDLADTLDGMLERLDRAFDSQQRFIANASHELRTPLAINRTLIEVAMLKEAEPDAALVQLGSTLLAVNQRHERLIEGLLMLASGGQEIADPEDVDLAEVASHVLGECAPMRSHGMELRSRLDAAPCRGDPVLLERLLFNLVDNAIRYNLPESGWMSVLTETDAQGRATVTVENPGPTIPPYEVPRLFEPFRRLAGNERLADAAGVSERRGAGLGLSIVRAIVTSHGGHVTAAARGEGGLSVTVVLPASKPNAKPTAG